MHMLILLAEYVKEKSYFIQVGSWEKPLLTIISRVSSKGSHGRDSPRSGEVLSTSVLVIRRARVTAPIITVSPLRPGPIIPKVASLLSP